jgi:hypothetical protein
MLKDIVEVRHLGSHRLYLRFEDGVSGELDLSSVVNFEGMFEPLKDEDFFSKVAVDKDSGTICWPNGADIDPDVLYARVTGRPIPDMEHGTVAA